MPDREHKDEKENVVSVEKRTHEPLRKFLQKCESEYNPMDIDCYAKHWKEKKHLTALPNEAKFNHGDLSSGEWIQRLIETVEVQAIHIENLNQRLKVLESK